MSETVYDPDAGGIGYLTWDQWDRLQRAWVTAHKHLPWWWVAGHIRSGDADELRRRSAELPLGLPATWLAAWEITRLMQELNRWPELEDAANDTDGAELALLLIREVQTAAAKWPIADKPHQVRYMRCQACDLATLRYLPPNAGNRPDAPRVAVQSRFRGGAVRENPEIVERAVLVDGKTIRSKEPLHRTVVRTELMDSVVRCTNPKCGAVMDHSMFEFAATLIAYEQEMVNGKRRVAADSGSPESGEPVETDGVPVGHRGQDSDDASGEGALAEPA